MKYLVKIRKHCFAGLAGVGLLAGIFDHMWLGSTAHYAIFLAMLCVILGASLGGFTGFFAINLLRTVRGKKAYTGQHNDGVLMGAFAGAFVGMMSQILLSAEVDPIAGATAGAFIGGAMGAIPDEFLQPVLLLLSGDLRPEAYTPPEVVFVEPADEQN